MMAGTILRRYLERAVKRFETETALRKALSRYYDLKSAAALATKETNYELRNTIDHLNALKLNHQTIVKKVTNRTEYVMQPNNPELIFEPVKPPKVQGTYIIQVAPSGLVKIGISKNIRNRMNNLQTASPFELRLVAYDRTGRYGQREYELHKRFSEYRVRGEWFYPDGELLEYLNKVAIKEE